MTDLEFSYPFAVGKGCKPKTELTLMTDDGQKTALASRFNLDAIETLQAKLSVTVNDSSTHVRVEGDITARVVYTCVISGESFAAPVEAQFVRNFDSSVSDDCGEDAEIEIFADDETDPLVGNSVDLGELVAEELGVALDPYPKKEGAVFDHSVIDARNPDEAGFVKNNPFAALEKLKKG